MSDDQIEELADVLRIMQNNMKILQNLKETLCDLAKREDRPSVKAKILARIKENEICGINIQTDIDCVRMQISNHLSVL